MKPSEFIYLYRIYLGWCYQLGSEPNNELELGDLANLVYQQIPQDQYSHLYQISKQLHPHL